MNENKKTVVIFFKQTRVNAIEAVDNCKESISSISNGLFGLFMVLLSIIAWIVGLSILLFLPIATKLRLYVERKTNEEVEKQRREIFERSAPRRNDDE